MDENAEPIVFPFYDKRPWREVLHVPGPDWRVGAVWDDAYHRGAKRLIEGVVRGKFLPAFEGVAGLYLFRHYLELALKFIIFHSRWLKDAQTNAKIEEIDDVKRTHSLRKLWDIAQAECRRVVPGDEWQRIDIEFVDACIREFDAIDPNGERFRYHGERFGVEKDPAKRQELAKTVKFDLLIDFEQLSTAIDHAYEVLNYLDVYMIENHGQNEEWEEYLNSL